MRKTYIALIRGVNAAGANSLPTADFVRVLQDLGLGDLRTYIQTGNAVFQAARSEAADLPAKITSGIQGSRGFAPEVMLLTCEELEAAVAGNPYPEADEDPKSLHLTFLADEPVAPDLQSLAQVRKPPERFALKGKVFYLHAPEGVGRSKLFAKVEKSLGVAGTARNWRSVGKILELAREVAGAGQGLGAGVSGLE